MATRIKACAGNQRYARLRPGIAMAGRRSLVLGTLYFSGLASVAAESSALSSATFNPVFFASSNGQAMDLSRFEQANRVEPGTYRLDLYVNQAWAGRQDIQLRLREDGSATFCLPPAQLEQLGIDLATLPAEQRQLALAAGDCVDPLAVIPQSSLDLDMTELRASLNIPQLYMSRMARGQVDPRDWDSGVTAGFVSYNANLFHADSSGQSTSQFQTSLNSGLNLGEWRLRHSGSYSHAQAADAGARSRYDAISSYAQRDITRLKSQLTIGEHYTPNEIFDSVPYTGVQLASDDRMLPDSMRGFAPVIRGVAETNARVSVRQGDNLLYETSVPPGPFALDDLYNTGYAGDLTVTVSEADGRSKSFIVPYASVAQLLRPGASRFSVSAGRYRDDALHDAPQFIQGTYQRGISNDWTAYTGSILAERYLAVQAGVALSTSLGALALDITQSQASGLPADDNGIGSDMSGQSYRLTYSKLLENSRTNFTLAAYRFSSAGYLGFSDFANLSAAEPGTGVFRQRSRFQLNLTQPLGDSSSLYLSGSAQNYWNKNQGSDTTYQVGYSTGFDWGSLNLGASRTRNGSGEFDTQYMLSVSVPLGRSPSSPYLSSSATYSDSGNSTLQSSLSGTAGARQQIGYGINGSRSQFDGERTSNVGANVQYAGPIATLSAGASQGDGYSQANLSASGSLVAHPGGVTLTQSQGETLAIVEAKGAKGAQVSNLIGAAVDGDGYAVVSGLTPYRRNEVMLDPSGTSDDVELQTTSQQVAPRAGAIVMLKYPTQSGKAVLMSFTRSDEQPIPLGAEVLDSQGNPLAMVGQAGLAFLRGLPQRGSLLIRWGTSPQQQCHADYLLDEPDAASTIPYQQLRVPCSVPAEQAHVAASY